MKVEKIGITFEHECRLAEIKGGIGVSPVYQTIKTHAWGLDLSGTNASPASDQGAGGVGGLLATTLHDSTTASLSTRYPSYDGNGNIMCYSDKAGTITANFEYAPFGELVRETGTERDLLTYRFSTKPQDLHTRLSYYGYRWYNSINSSWMRRDPIGEQGGLNLYGFVGNDGVNRWDYLGYTDLDNRVFQHGLTGALLHPFSGRTSDFAVTASEAELEITDEMISKLEEKAAETVCSDNQDYDFEETFGFYQTNHLIALGKIAVILKGTIKCNQGGKWKFEGELDPQNEPWDFNRSWLNGDGGADDRPLDAEIVVMLGAAAQEGGALADFNINFTGVETLEPHEGSCN